VRDLQQRSFWFTLGTRRSVRLEAAGRALSDLRILSEHGDLLAADATARRLEAVPGHPLRSVLLTPVLELDNYRVTAYGGRSLPRGRWRCCADIGAADGRVGRTGWKAGSPAASVGSAARSSRRPPRPACSA
jgi:hypothetical protein